MAGLISSQMAKDWNDYWNTTKSGDKMSWGNGTMTRNADGSATYNSNNGSSATYNAGMSMDDVARSNKEIANKWKNDYGYQLPTDTAIPEFRPVIAATGGGPAAVTRKVTDDELTSNRLSKLLQGDSPYIRQAADRAIQLMGDRGLVNSSLAAAAGTSAAIDAALPIASAEANTYGAAARDNQSAQNNFNLADKQAANNAAQLSAQMQMQSQLADIAAARQEKLVDKQFGQQYQLQQEQNKFNAAQQDKSQAFQLEQLKQNMNLAYDKLTLDQTNKYADGYLNIVNSNMLAEDKAIALSNYSLIYGFADGYQPATGVDISALPAAEGG